MDEREELLDAGGRYAEAMYDALTREVRQAADEEWAERVAVLEYDGGLPRAEAERLAWIEVGGGWPFAGPKPAARPRGDAAA